MRVVWLVISLVLAGWVTFPGRATAMQRCGDDVAGATVPCACGDLVVSSHRLGDADPVTAAACPGNGLLVDATGTVTLDLGGRRIAGSGQGVGVLVLGGRLVLTGPGTIERFETGVLARGAGDLASMRDVRVVANQLDGISAHGDGFSVEGVVAEGNGRDGFTLGGRGYALDGNRASRNGRHGFRLAGIGAHAGGGLGNEARENVGAGFSIVGRLHQLLDVTAIGNGGDGITLVAAYTLVARVHADANLGSGLFAFGGGLGVADSTADGNRGFGVWVDGPGATDGGGNRGVNNSGLTRSGNRPPGMYSGWMAPLLQCRVGEGACR